MLLEELQGFGFAELREQGAGAVAVGTLEAGYRACLWSRTAGRVLLELARGPAGDGDALYATVREVDWREHLTSAQTLAANATLQRATLRHSHFAAQRVKDAIVDQLREQTGSRPSVQPTRPDVTVHVLVRGDQAVLSLDLSGEPLHRRGYRLEQGAAPLRETLAAALLLRAGWPQIAAAGGAFVDPMCGAGTLLIEAAWMAADIAPGLLARRYWGFTGWRGHDGETWEALLGEARERAEVGTPRAAACFGFDADVAAQRVAQGNLLRAGLADHVLLRRRDVTTTDPLPVKLPAQGLVMANPPYGERLGEQHDLAPLYRALGMHLREHYGEGWKGAVFTGNPPLGRELGIKARRSHRFLNGQIDCRLLQFDLGQLASANAPVSGGDEAGDAPPTLSAGAEELANRLRKNLKHLARWRRREGVSCYRLYDADLPEYRVAVDVYESVPDGELHAHVQEYAAPAKVDEAKARTRLIDACAGVRAVLEIPARQVHRKRRQRQRGGAQYQRQGHREQWFTVAEHGYQVWVNLDDYLDTGLFLDHRPLRRWLLESAADQDFLNLFAYTGAASVAAAVGGARSTTSVDLSNTYLEWAQRNLELNVPARALDQHRVVREDVLKWVGNEARPGGRRYGVILLDPPSFSTSKRMEAASFDVQRDHPTLLRQCLDLLTPDGTLWFSNNLRSFALEEAALVQLGCQVEDRTRESIPPDYARNDRIHRCWRIRRGVPTAT